MFESGTGAKHEAGLATAAVGIASRQQPTASDDAHLVADKVSARRWRRRPSRVGRAAPLLAAALTGAVLFVALSDQGRAVRTSGSLLADLDSLAAAAGLVATQISVTGHGSTSDRQIFEALGDVSSRSLLTFDAQAARQRIAALPWIEAVVVRRLLPDRIDVHVTERRAFARWRHGERVTLVDRTGRELAEVGAGVIDALPRIAGRGAPVHAAALLDVVARFPEIGRRLVEAEWIGQRRWRLRLEPGPVVDLPGDGEEGGLVTLMDMHRAGNVLDRGLVRIDLRIPGRAIVEAAPATTNIARPRQVGRGT